MANLETLELTISSTSGAAKQGIDSLSQSLSALSRAVGKSVGGLMRINAELAKLKSAGRIKLPTVSPIASQPSKAAKAITDTVRKQYVTAEQIAKSRELQEAQNKAAALPPEAMAAQQAWSRNQIKERMDKLSLQRQAAEQRKLAEEANKTAPAVRNTANAIKETAAASTQASPKVSGFVKLFQQIGRIAKTMLIRTAIRSLIKAFSEAWNNAYQFSKNMGGQFAKNVDLARGALSSVATNIITALSPALNALMPIIYTVAAGINYLCTLLQRLFSLLGMGSDLFGTSAEAIDKYSKSAGGGGSATKGLLAAWDQLNVIQNKSGGGGGGGGGGKAFFSDMVSEEMAGINMLVAESMLAIGLILACSGHVGIGLGLMAVGAASIAKTLFEDWGKLPSQVQTTIAKIMGIAGAGMMAVGLILACTGHLGVGLGLMALGALNLGAIMGITQSGDGIVNEVTKTIMKIMVVAALGLMAVGLIVAIFGNPLLGIGMIIAGAGMWFSAASYGGTDGLVSMVQEVLSDIEGFFLDTWRSITEVWDQVDHWFYENVFKPIEDFAAQAWESISQWWKGNIAEPFEGAWESVTDFFKNLFGSSEIPGSIAGYANEAYISISEWWDSNIAEPFSNAWSAVTTFFEELWDGISEKATSAWESLSNWFSEDILTNFKKGWDGVKTFFKGIWKDITKWISGAWSYVASFSSSDILGSIRKAWDGVVGFFNSIFDPIKKALSSIWNFITKIFGASGSHTTDYSINIKYNVDGSPDLAGMGLVNLPSYIDPYKKFSPSGTNSYSIKGHAEGAYGIPRGDVFIANEQGAELVGSIGGKTSVANQDQIIEGIQNGVRNANKDQNDLLREQNNLLRGLLDKEWSVNPSAGWGKFNQRSNELWAMQNGR